MTQACILKPDTKGRITLGKLAKGVSSFHVIVNSKKGQIILEPYTEIPLKESWLFNNKKALVQLNNGIKDSAKGQVKFIETDIVIARSEATRQSRKIIKNSVNQNF